MGTINYMTSDYITLGVRPMDVDDFKADKPEIIQNMLENGYYNIIDRCGHSGTMRLAILAIGQRPQTPREKTH